MTEILEFFSRFQSIKINKTVQTFNMSVNFKDSKKIDHILESLLAAQSFLMHFMSFINYRKSKTIFKSSLNSHAYWDTLWLNLIFNLCEETISRTGEGQPRPKYIFNKCGTNIYFFTLQRFGPSQAEFLNLIQSS